MNLETIHTANAGGDAIYRGRLEAQIEVAEASGDEFKIRGRVNSFRVMRSGRLFHPRAFDRWLKANPSPRIPLLGNHGETPGFATIGQITKLTVKPGEGLLFEGVLGAGTQLADDARKLVAQRLLTGISPGWISKQQRYVRLKDADLDDEVRAELERSGVDEALLFLDAALVEVSLVDVPDDAEARLAAKSARGGGETADLSERFVAAALEVASKRFQATFTGLLADVRAEIAEIVEAAVEAQADRIAALRAEAAELAELAPRPKAPTRKAAGRAAAEKPSLDLGATDAIIAELGGASQ